MDLSALNEKQKQAVKYLDGPLLILAGAGSGKTRTLTYKIAYLIEKGIPEKNILAVTFTNKAANEMKQRIKTLLKKNRLSLFAGTFHSLGARILRENPKEIKNLFSRNSNFVIFDDADRLSLIKKVLKELDLPIEQFPPPLIIGQIGYAKIHLKTPDNLLEEAQNFLEQKIAKVFERYEEKLKEYNAFDFDDLILKVVLLFKKSPESLRKYQEKFKYILIDEYQDTNFVQYQLVKLLASKYKKICVVGDDQQAIYGFRFADFKNILNFEKDFPKTKVVVLEENYRSTKNILEAANFLIKKNIFQKPKKLWTQNESGSPIFLVETKDEKEEAYMVVGKIKELLENNISAKQIAVFYRTNAQSRPLEEAFIQYGIPYQIVGGFRFYERKEIKDILAYLRLAVNPFDKVSLERVINVPPRKLGKKTLETFLPKFNQLFHNKKELEKFPDQVKNIFAILKEIHKKAKTLSLIELINFVIKKTDYQEYLERQKDGEMKIENLGEIFSAAMPFDKLEPPNGLFEFLESIALLQEADQLQEKQNSTKLMTLHSAKGLEFDYVFIVGVEDGILPYWKSKNSLEDIEEERRLLYVGITRAKKEVYLLYTQKRLVFGDMTFSKPSSFLDDLPKDLTFFISTSYFKKNG